MKLRLLFFAAGAIVLFLVVRRWPEPRSASETANLHETRLARHLLSRGEWQVHEAPTGHIHYRTNSYAAQTIAPLSRSVDSVRTAVLAFLQVRDAQPIEIFLVSSRGEMQQLVGRPIGGMVQSGERTALLLHNETYSPFIAHELAHLYTHHHWGVPRAGRWISEGIAALAAGDCQGHSVASLVKGLHADGRLHPWPELVARFDSIDEISANLQAASMVAVMKQQRGIRAVREVWMKEDWRPPPPLEQAWLAAVTAAPFAARLDERRLQQNGCTVPQPSSD